jgi:hypothetical protein
MGQCVIAHGSLQRVVENPLKYPYLTIVYLLIPSGHIVDTLNPKRNKAWAGIVPIYIYNKDILIYIRE